VRQVRSPANYWQGAYEISQFMKTQWEEEKDFRSFHKVLREQRDYYSLQILSDSISPLNVIINNFCFIHEGDSRLSEDDDEDDILSIQLKEIKRVFHNKEE
jgi:hypothetical protein